MPLANLGGQFAADKLIFGVVPAGTTLRSKLAAVKQPSGFYHSDYRDDFALGDDPYRYYNW